MTASAGFGPLTRLLAPLVLAVVPALAQDPARIQVTTRMVEVSVVARDKLGNPVSGLTREDFRLLDGGREEAIRWFVEESAAAAPRDGRRSGVPTAILFDNLNSLMKDTGYGRYALLRFFREVEIDQPIALLSLHEEFVVLQTFTTETAALVRALESYRPHASLIAAGLGGPRRPPPPISSRGGLGDPFRAVDALAAGMYASRRIRMTEAGAGALAKFLAAYPGRKNLIWLSSTFPGYLAASVRSDDVAIYPVDVRAPINGPPESARLLAARTGGEAFWNGNDLLGPLRQAYTDRKSAYLLGYYPSHDTWNRQFRPIQVQAGRPGIQLRYRPGYVAFPDR